MDYDFSLAEQLEFDGDHGIKWKARGTFFPESTFDLTPPAVTPPDVASLVENVPEYD